MRRNNHGNQSTHPNRCDVSGARGLVGKTTGNPQGGASSSVAPSEGFAGVELGTGDAAATSLSGGPEERLHEFHHDESVLPAIIKAGGD